MRTARFRHAVVTGVAGPADIATWALRRLVDRIAAALLARHGALLDRLSDFEGASLRIEPSDLPFAVVVEFRASGPTTSLVRHRDAPAARAAIRAPLHVLLDIAEGRIDGDGMFFARTISISGDTGLVVALRNSLDDAEIDLAGAAADACGPLGPMLRPALAIGREIAGRLSRLAGSRAPT